MKKKMTIKKTAKIQDDTNGNDNDRLDEDIDVSNSDKYKWHYLDKSDFGQSHDVSTTTANQSLRHGNNGNGDDDDDNNDDDFDDEYIDPNDDGNSYAHIKNIDMYSSILGGGAGQHGLTAAGPKKKSKRAKSKSKDFDEELTDISSNNKKGKVGAADVDLNIVGRDNDAELDDIDDDLDDDENDEDNDDDDDDVDIDDDDDSYGLRRSTSKGDMNWNEDEQKRLLTMANFIHNNTGGSPVSAIANSNSNSNNANNINETGGNKKQ